MSRRADCFVEHLRIDGETIETAPDHRFLTDPGWVEAQALYPGTKVQQLDGTFGTSWVKAPMPGLQKRALMSYSGSSVELTSSRPWYFRVAAVCLSSTSVSASSSYLAGVGRTRQTRRDRA